MQPNKTLALGRVLGKKVSMDRITVAFACNITGTQKLKLVVIHKFKNPRAFRGFDPQQLVHWHANKTAWMNGEVSLTIWQQYLYPQYLLNVL
jgi:DDE superfamily endonuclease